MLLNTNLQWLVRYDWKPVHKLIEQNDRKWVHLKNKGNHAVEMCLIATKKGNWISDISKDSVYVTNCKISK